MIFLFRCIRLCQRCKATYSSVLIAGLAFLITTQAFLHILVNVRILPITGHTLPLISHGGTAYLVLCGAFGMILSVNKQLEKQDAMERAARAAAEAIATVTTAATATAQETTFHQSTSDLTEINYTTSDE